MNEMGLGVYLGRRDTEFLFVTTAEIGDAHTHEGCCFGHTMPLRQQTTGTQQAAMADIFVGRKAGGGFQTAVKGGGTHAELLCQTVFVEVRFLHQVVDDAFRLLQQLPVGRR